MVDDVSDILIDSVQLADVWDMKPSTIRKYSAAAESTGYRFKRLGKRSKLMFSSKEIDAFKKAIEMKEEQGDDLKIEDAIAIVFTAMLDDVADIEADISPVTDIVSATSADIADIAGSIADLTKVISDMSSKIERLEGQNIEQAKSYESKISELSKQNNELIETMNRIESNISKNDDILESIRGTTNMLNEMTSEFAVSKEKKGFFRKLFGK
ncbi:hypothetical protein BIV60_12060 [Bacillus sp. MUM 116]|uniref:hypothetical protein n=1 Tax=Bacillus sp. MUM 116 TaxID=1678002 RepID=UPI0008F5B728|nr:hypothetical protein [Bacillus sp. MUM 116]OIK14234.1 hypothetical protein BIV60_12060 [Bacillus sp. MUM 116]